MLMAAYPNARVPDGTVLLYESILIEHDRDRCAEAVRKIIKTSKFFPTIAEIVSAYEGEKPTDEIPYHRRFAPPRRRGLMRSSELAAEAKAWLAKHNPPTAPAPEPEPASEPKEPKP
jgi:hypothetical protein